MIIISSREFRDNQAKYLNKVDEGEQIIVQRGKDKSYTLTPVKEDDLYLTPQMMQRLKASLQQAKAGQVKSVTNEKELADLLESL